MDTFTRMADEWIRAHCPEIGNETPQRNSSIDCGIEAAAVTHDPNYVAWLPEFEAWVAEQCFFRDRCFGGVGSLHVHFAEWCVKSGSVPCDRQDFESILRDQDVLFADGLVSGLILSADETERRHAVARARKHRGRAPTSRVP